MFPKHFTPAMAERWAHNPKFMAKSPMAVGWERPTAEYRRLRIPRRRPISGHWSGWRIETAGVPDKNGADFEILQNPDLIIDPSDHHKR